MVHTARMSVVSAPLVHGDELGYRLRPAGGDVTALDVSSGFRLPVVRLSPVDLSLVTGAPEALMRDRSCRLQVHADIDPINARADLARPISPNGMSEVRMRFDNIDLRVGLDLQALLLRLRRSGAIATPDAGPRENERVVDGARIRSILRALFANHAEGGLRAAGLPAMRVRAAQIDPRSPFPLRIDLEGACPRAPFSIELTGYNSLFRFEVSAVTEKDGLFAFAVPRELLRIRRRNNRWTPAPGGVEVTFRHPVWPELQIRRPVRDLSFDGIGFATNGLNDLLYPGLEIQDVALELGDRLRIEFSGVVRHVSPSIGGAAEIAGMRLTPQSPDDEARWRRELDTHLFPNTRMDGAWGRELWALYDRSGYFGLSDHSAENFAGLKEPFVKVSRLVASHPDLGCQVVWPSRRGVEAAISLLKIYRSTTFIYQLARQHGRTPSGSGGRTILRDIYLHAIEHTQRDPDLRWLAGWVQESAGFSRRVHVDLPLRYLPERRTFIQRFYAMGGSCNEREYSLDREVEIAPATLHEVDILLAALSTRSAIFLDAHDLVPERIDLGEIGRVYATAGLRRRRTILIARRGGRAMAAGVLEMADNGLHLFGLLDVVRLFALAEGGESLFGALLESARDWYRQLGKSRFVYFCESADRAHARNAGLDDLGGADLTLFPAELLPELLEHVHELTSPGDVPALPATDDA